MMHNKLQDNFSKPNSEKKALRQRDIVAVENGVSVQKVRNHEVYYSAKTCDNFDKNRRVNVKFEMYGTYTSQNLGNKKAATG